MTAQTQNPFIEMDAAYNVRLGGDQWVFTFANGYGASVICNKMSYGGSLALYELAVLDDQGALCYDTGITDDVLGWLSIDDVRDLLRSIAELPVSS